MRLDVDNAAVGYGERAKLGQVVRRQISETRRWARAYTSPLFILIIGGHPGYSTRGHSPPNVK